MTIHEKPHHRVNQNIAGCWLAKNWELHWREEENVTHWCDGYLTNGVNPLMAVEVKWREKKYDDLRVDVSKIDKLIIEANKAGMIPVLVVRTPNQLWFRVCGRYDEYFWKTGTMSLNSPRDTGDVEDKVIILPWSAFQLVC